MKVALRQIPKSLRGSAKLRYLAPDACEALLVLEKETGGLVYTEFLRDAVGSLLAKRQRRDTQHPGYSAANYGLAVTLDLSEILEHRGISYTELLLTLGKFNWFCHRRDGEGDQPGSDHFYYLGQYSTRYLLNCSLDPKTWANAGEERLFERHGSDFQLDVKTVQLLLSNIGLYTGEPSGQLDLYTREAISAFQRAWGVPETGQADFTLCRVLAFVTADFQVS